MLLTDGANQFLFVKFLCLLFFIFSFSFIFFHLPLIPASLQNRLCCKEQAYCDHRKKIYNSFYIKDVTCKIIKVSAQIKHIQDFLNTALKILDFTT